MAHDSPNSPSSSSLPEQAPTSVLKPAPEPAPAQAAASGKDLARDPAKDKAAGKSADKEKDAARERESEERKAHIAQIFRREFDTVAHYQSVMDRDELTLGELYGEYKSLGKKYESLLRQTTKILRTGDAAQRKLMSMQHELEWRQNLNALWIAQFLAMMGANACQPFFPLFVRNLGVTNLAEAQFWSGLIFAGPFILSIIAVPLWGTLGDRHGKKAMIVRAVVGLTFTLFLMGFVQNVWQLFALRVIQGLVAV
jgi:Major Facilitator Superfamily